MNDLEEFEFWLGEYRDSPDFTDSEKTRMLQVMIAAGNAHAINFAKESITDVLPPVELKEDSIAKHSDMSKLNEPCVDDFDGHEWAGYLGIHEDSMTALDTLLTVEEEGDLGYTADWSHVANAIKEARKWRCERCFFEKSFSGLIQVHHIDGDKQDNSIANLQVLCAHCHGKAHGKEPLWPIGVTKAERNELIQFLLKRRVNRA